MTYRLQKKNILELGQNQIFELIEQSTQKVIDNINDLDTDPTKARTITIKLTFKADDERKKIDMKSVVNQTLAPKQARGTTLMNIRDENMETGEVMHVLKEVTDEIPGQLNINGHITPQEEIVIGAYADMVIRKAMAGHNQIDQAQTKEIAETAEGEY